MENKSEITVKEIKNLYDSLNKRLIKLEVYLYNNKNDDKPIYDPDLLKRNNEVYFSI